MQHHTKPATSILPWKVLCSISNYKYVVLACFVTPLLHWKTFFILLSFHSEVYLTFFQTLISAAILDTLPWENVLCELHQNRDKLPTGFASGCQTALMNDRGRERPDRSFTLAPHLRSDFTKAFKISPKYTSSDYTRAQNEDIKLCRSVWPIWALLWTRWQIEIIKIIYLSYKKNTLHKILYLPHLREAGMKKISF